MYRILIGFLLLLALPFGANAQFSLDKTSQDLGTLTATSSRMADFVLTNQSSEPIFIMRIDRPDDVTIRLSEQTVQPGASVTIRVQYNPERTGNFRRDLDVVISSTPKPVRLQIYGKVSELDPSAITECPSFDIPKNPRPVEGPLRVLVLDSATGQPLHRAEVIIGNTSWYTNRDGRTEMILPVGPYQITAGSEGYRDSSQMLYLSRQVQEVVFVLGKEPEPPLIVLQEEPPVEEPPVVAEPEPEPEQPPVAVAPPPAPVPADTFVEEPGELSAREYVANNVVFLIDVSSSMKYPHKLPFLKTSMTNLVSLLRSIDRLAIVTYASDVKVVMKPTPVKDKDKMAKTIESLYAYGLTKGGQGIREAYRVAEENFIPGGNNTIILATDGDFELDKSDAALMALIREKAAQGIHLSVIGFGSNPEAIEKMKKLAEAGGGFYTHVRNEEEAKTALATEISAMSRKESAVIGE